MEKFVEHTYLYDFYGELLTEHQRQIYESVTFDDLSLAEAADELNISRQGVHDIIKRCNSALESYESKLHLVEKFLALKKKAEEIKRLAGEKGDMKKIASIADEIIDEL